MGTSAIVYATVREKALEIQHNVDVINKKAGADDTLFRQLILEYFLPNDVKKKLTW
jgi:hypothetical protein